MGYFKETDLKILGENVYLLSNVKPEVVLLHWAFLYCPQVPNNDRKIVFQLLALYLDIISIEHITGLSHLY